MCVENATADLCSLLSTQFGPETLNIIFYLSSVEGNRLVKLHVCAHVHVCAHLC